MLHACFYPLSCVLSTLWSTFHMISWTNLLTRATVRVACFLLFLVPRKSENKYSRNWTGQKPKCLFFQKTHGAGIRDGGGPGVVAPCTPSVSLFAYKKPSDLKTSGGSTFFHKKFCCAAATEGEIRGTESLCSGTLPGRVSALGAISIDLHHHLHHHC